MQHLPVLQTERLILFIPGPQDAERCVAFNRANEAHLAAWDPPMSKSQFDLEVVRSARQTAIEEALAERRFSFALTARDAAPESPLLGWVYLSSIMRGVFQACYLSYSLDENAQGDGYMSEALLTVISFAFQVLRLHRLMSNYMPHNARSAKVLQRLGFTIEGRAEKYLYIANAWQDHVLTSLTNPDSIP